MDERTVTNAAFACFVAATGYVTIAERPLDGAQYPGATPDMPVPGSLVFRISDGPVETADCRNRWAWTQGACWHRPEGPGSTIEGREDHPVVHVASEDAEACASWAGKALPTEDEWEFAARGGLEGTEFARDKVLTPDGAHLADTWQGPFAWRNSEADGFAGTCPVRAFPPGGHGPFEACGNAREWTTDRYAARHEGADPARSSCCAPGNPRGPAMEGSFDPAMPTIRIPRKVVRGGRVLCAPSHCRRYRPAARHAQMVDSGMRHIGFRRIRRGPRGRGTRHDRA